eukprot:TRINITY_DN1187_c0_g1_i4.p2 TRINITY_DN1187_c0_g1~~TRINITY_DN1187_c0_g1_i4.p2  ORF type:complete len:152 (-),score=19.54 TRINITY_DN1187_c0_g1_i4:112-567(-)
MALKRAMLENITPSAYAAADFASPSAKSPMKRARAAAYPAASAPARRESASATVSKKEPRGANAAVEMVDSSMPATTELVDPSVTSGATLPRTVALAARIMDASATTEPALRFVPTLQMLEKNVRSSPQVFARTGNVTSLRCKVILNALKF